MRFTLLLGLVLTAFPLFAEEPKPKLPVPSEAEQAKAAALVKEVYKADYDKAKTAEQKLALAKKLLQDGVATKDDAVGRFVLYRIGRDVASSQGDLSLAFTSIARLCDEFEADKLAMQVATASVAVKAARQPKELSACAAILKPTIDAAIGADRYAEAKSLHALALDAAREARDTDRVKQLVGQGKELDEIAAEYARVQASIAILRDKPSNTAANLAVGRFRCLYKGDWGSGVPLLALGSDENLKAAALLELAEQPNPLKTGDAWWQVAEGLEGRTQFNAQAHAGQWYRKAAPSLSGLSKANVDRRLQELASKAQREPEARKSNTTRLRERTAPDAVKIGDHYYKVFLQKDIPWHLADEACKKMGGYLACFETQEEKQALARLKGMGTPSKPGNGKIIWVGAYQKKDGSFTWINGLPLDTMKADAVKDYAVCFLISDALGYRERSGIAKNVVIPYVQGFICEWDE